MISGYDGGHIILANRTTVLVVHEGILMDRYLKFIFIELKENKMSIFSSNVFT